MRHLFLLGVAACVAGCTSGSDDKPFVVVSTAPIADAVDAPTDTQISANFSLTLDVTSVDANSFLVLRDGEAIKGELGAADNKASFIPSERLCPMTSYDARATIGIRSVSKKTLASNYPWSFTTADGTWEAPPTRIDEASEVPSDSVADIAADAAGNAIAVWEQFAGANFEIWARRFEPGTGWLAPERIETQASGCNGCRPLPKVAMSANGVAVVVWQYETGPYADMWANRYSPGTGWEGAQKLENDDDWDVNHARVAVDADGNFLAVWIQDVEPGVSGYQIYASRLLASGGGWTAPVQVSNVGEDWQGNGSGSPSSFSLAVGPDGEALLAWDVIISNTNAKVLAARMNSSGTWAMPMFVDPCTLATCSNAPLEPQAAITSTGEGIVVFLEGAQQHDLFAVHDNGNGGWDAPIALESQAEVPFEPRIAVDGAGNAIAVWEYASDPTTLQTARYVPADGWSAPAGLTGPANGGVFRPAIHFDDRDNALVMWDSQGPILAARWLASSESWSTPAIVNPEQSAEYNVAFAFVPGCGNALAVWNGGEGISALQFH